MFTGRKADDSQPGIAVAERRHWRVPPARVLVATFLPEDDQPGTERAIARCLGLRDRRQIGGAGEAHYTDLGEPAWQAQRSSTRSRSDPTARTAGSDARRAWSRPQLPASMKSSACSTLRRSCSTQRMA